MAAVKMDMEQARFNMIEQQIRPWEVLDPEVLDILGEVKREDFVPEALRALAFADLELPIGNGQTMLQPEDRGAHSAGSRGQEHRHRARGRYRQRLHGRPSGGQGASMSIASKSIRLAETARQNLRQCRRCQCQRRNR
jgi:hypothetical protein